MRTPQTRVLELPVGGDAESPTKPITALRALQHSGRTAPSIPLQMSIACNICATIIRIA